MSAWSLSRDVYEVQDVKKVVVVGEPGCGKTALIRKFLAMTGARAAHATLPKYQASVQIGSVVVQTVLLDAASSGCGGEDPDLRAWLYRGAHAAVACFSLDRPDTLARATGRWVPEVRRCLPGAPVVLAGLRADARRPDPQGGKQCVSHLEAFRAAGGLNLERYVECSALTGEGVREVFTSAAFATMSVPELLAFHRLHSGAWD